MQLKNSNTKWVIGGLLFLWACAPVLPKTPEVEPAPKTYGEWTNADTTNSGTISWRNFFTDKHLLSLIDTAMLYNPDLQIANQRVLMANAELLRSKAAMIPTLNANLSPAIRRYGLYTMDGAGNISTFIQPGKIVPINLPDIYVGLQSSWEADVWGKLRSRKKAATARWLASNEGRNWMTTQVVSNIALHYYELQALDNMLRIVDETIVLQENALNIVQVQKEAAAANQLAVEQFAAQLLNTKAIKTQLQQQVVDNETALQLLLGKFPGTVVRDTANYLTTAVPAMQTGVPAMLLQQRPDIRQATFLLEATKMDVQAARAAFLPGFNITAAFGYQAFQPNLLFRTPESMAYALAGSIVAPLLNRGALKAEFASANARQIEALFQYQQTVLTGVAEVYNEMKRLQNLEQLYQQRNEQATVLTTSIETASALFRSGRATYLELLINQQNALQARLEVIAAKKQQWQTSVNLYKALGGGW